VRINQHTQLYGVIGSPVGHSLSPSMHNAAFSALQLNAVYLAFEVADLQGCLAGVRALGIRGLSVTIPHKEAVMPLLDSLDHRAACIGAVNTIVNRDGKLVGYNTDGSGALRALEDRISVAGRTCLLVGAGGAARAIGFVLKEGGASITVANRSAERGQALARFLGCSFVPLAQLPKIAADLLVQTTPVGMAPQADQCPVPEDVLRTGMTVMDIIYNPLETRLLQIARSRGCRTINGLAMFVYQGAEQFRLWTGLQPPIEEMQQAVRQALHPGATE